MSRISKVLLTLLASPSISNNSLVRSAVSCFLSPHCGRREFCLTSVMSGISTYRTDVEDLPTSVAHAMKLLDSVYGPVDDAAFPLPMPVTEAGLCRDQHQRRYLWTDAFGVLAFVSLAEKLEDIDKHEVAKPYRRAAHTLIDTVHASLGYPRSSRSSEAMTVDPTHLSPTGLIGLRIGKLESRKVTDYGMRYDGQYFHYVDKWLLALVRAGRAQDAMLWAKSCFPYFFDKGDAGNGWNGGIRWKLSVDASPAPGLERAYASDDTLVAIIVFSIIEAHKPADMTISLQDEIELLRSSLIAYRPRVTDDPLGWGLEAMYDRFLEGQPRQATLHSLHTRALHASHLSLPFRLYGAIMGARLGGAAVAPPSLVDQMLKLSVAHEEPFLTNAVASLHGGKESHSSINRVMLAMCLLCPGALARHPDDPVIRLS